MFEVCQNQGYDLDTLLELPLEIRQQLLEDSNQRGDIQKPVKQNNSISTFFVSQNK